jgi:hypothetical protein
MQLNLPEFFNTNLRNLRNLRVTTKSAKSAQSAQSAGNSKICAIRGKQQNRPNPREPTRTQKPEMKVFSPKLILF